MKTFTLNMQVTQSSVLLLENPSLEYQNCSQNHISSSALDHLNQGREHAEDFPSWVHPSLFHQDKWNLKKENTVVTNEYQKWCLELTWIMTDNFSFSPMMTKSDESKWWIRAISFTWVSKNTPTKNYIDNNQEANNLCQRQSILGQNYYELSIREYQNNE